jgi:hypothetical protein
VALPEVPLLAVLPGTGGLTRLVDKRHVRRDRADFFSTTEEGVKGKRAVEWGLVDEVVPRTKLAEIARARAAERAAKSDRPRDAKGIALTPLQRTIDADTIRYPHVTCTIDRARGLAEITVAGTAETPPADAAGVHAQGARFWPLAIARALDDLILHLRTNEEQIGLWVVKTAGDGERELAAVDLDGRAAGHLGDREHGPLADGDHGLAAEEHSRQRLIARGDPVLQEDVVLELQRDRLRGGARRRHVAFEGGDHAGLGRLGPGERRGEGTQRQDGDDRTECRHEGGSSAHIFVGLH